MTRPDIYDVEEPERDPVEAVLAGVHNRVVLLAREIMASQPILLDEDRLQALEDAVGDFSAVSKFIEAALLRSKKGL